MSQHQEIDVREPVIYTETPEEADKRRTLFQERLSNLRNMNAQIAEQREKPWSVESTQIGLRVSQMADHQLLEKLATRLDKVQDEQRFERRKARLALSLGVVLAALNVSFLFFDVIAQR